MPQEKHSTGTELLPLFAPLEPYATGTLELDAPHRMYFEQSGNQAGTPVVFLHGGPGAGARAVHRQFFDPSPHRLIIYDQRRAGRSTPPRCLQRDTTGDLVEDLERLRPHLRIERL